MENIMNFRDLGGLNTKDGRKVKKGFFYRSARLNEASEKDIEELKALGLKQIFDYRDDFEVKYNYVDIYSIIDVKHAHYPSQLNNDKLYKLKKSSHLRKLFHKVSIDDVKMTYTYLPFDNLGYKAMVKALKEEQVPFLQHCSAGKDRAGFGSALLLLILGVEYDEILKDYLKSLEVRDYIEEKLAQFIPRILRKPMVKRYEPLLIVDKVFLDAAFEEIKVKYDSFENYFLQEFDLNEKDLEDIRNRYTE